MSAAAPAPAASSGGEFTGRRILLTGATGSIGRAAARILAAAGADLVLSGRDAAKLAELAASLPASAAVAPCDLAQGDAIPVWLRELAEQGGPFAGIAHMAGVQAVRPLRTISAEFINADLRANLASGLMLGKALRQKGCHADGAALVLSSSTAAFIGGRGNTAYAASKGGVIAATRAMALELARDGIRVNCVVPGLVESDMAERAKRVTPSESWNALLSGYPMGIGKPEDVAHAAIYLLSPRAKWVTGTALQVDGGLGIV